MARPSRPNEKKLDSRTVSCYFVGYSERSRRYKLFYDPTTKSILRQEMQSDLRMSSLPGEILLKTLSLKRNMFVFPQVLLALIRTPILVLFKTQQIKTKSRNKLLHLKNLCH